LKELVKNFSERGKVEFEWMNDPHYGHGVYILPDKSRYDGQFKGGSFNGKGIFKWPDGGEYNGEWKNGLPNGQGIMTLPNGSRYEGEWKKGRFGGKVSFVFSSLRKSPPKKGSRQSF